MIERPLTEKAISLMLKTDQASNQMFLVQATKIHKTKSTYLSMMIYDGEETTKAVTDLEKGGKKLIAFDKIEGPVKFMIHEFITHTWKKKKIIEILDLTLVDYPSQVKKEQSTLLKLEKFEKTFQLQQRETQLLTQIPLLFSMFPTKLKLKLSQGDDEETKPLEEPKIDIKSFEKIQDLYIGIHGWQILVRVIDKNYREFISKQGKQMKVLNLEFIDRTGYTIQGTFFGLQAQYRNADIHKGKVYRVARGKLEEENYRKRKNGKQSQLSIKFFKDSSVVEVEDFPEIPQCFNNWIRLSQITAESTLDDIFDVVVLLLEIGEEKVIPKEDRTVIMRYLKVGDPISEVIFEAVVWGRQVKVTQDMLNKTFVLKNFKISKYKESLHLTSTFMSNIEPHNLFHQFEGEWLPLSIKKFNEFDDLKTLKDLSFEVKNIKEFQSITSTINVWLSSICFGIKWFYDSCPNQKCKKATTPFTFCEFCSAETWECVKRFSLTVQLSDYTGSIYITAFNEAASIFLKDANIDELVLLSDDQRREFGQQLCYEHFTIKISSKLDTYGKIKHSIINKPEQVDARSQCRCNLNLIDKMKQYKNSLFLAIDD